MGTHPLRDKITSSGLHSIQSTPIQSDSTHSNPMQSDWTQSKPVASNPTNANRLNSNPTHGIDSITGQSNPESRDGSTTTSSRQTQAEKIEYIMKHLECLDRHITQYEQAVDDQFEEHEITIKEVRDHSLTVAESHNQVADEVNQLFQTVHKMQQSWENWNEWTPVDQDQDQEEGQDLQLPVEEESWPENQQPVMETQQPVLDHSSRTTVRTYLWTFALSFSTLTLIT